jgi:hypothetical protein
MNTFLKSNENDEIMSEMQVLNVQPEPSKGGMFQDMIVETVDYKTKVRLLEWLASDINLVKYNIKLIEDLPLYC